MLLSCKLSRIQTIFADDREDIPESTTRRKACDGYFLVLVYIGSRRQYRPAQRRQVGTSRRERRNEKILIRAEAIIASSTICTSRSYAGVAARDANRDTLQAELHELIALTADILARYRLDEAEMFEVPSLVAHW